MQDQVMAFGAIILTNIAAIFGAYASLLKSNTELKVKVDRLLVDVDNLAEIIGTERSRGRKEK